MSKVYTPRNCIQNRAAPQTLKTEFHTDLMNRDFLVRLLNAAKIVVFDVQFIQAYRADFNGDGLILLVFIHVS